VAAALPLCDASRGSAMGGSLYHARPSMISRTTFAGDYDRDPAAIGIATGGGATSIDDLLDRLPRLEKIGVTITSVPILFWARSFNHALELMEAFAQRAQLQSR
jgi:hypothetical protein